MKEKRHGEENGGLGGERIVNAEQEEGGEGLIPSSSVFRLSSQFLDAPLHVSNERRHIYTKRTNDVNSVSVKNVTGVSKCHSRGHQ